MAASAETAVGVAATGTAQTDAAAPSATPARLVNLTWAIPEHIGGMTATMFDRTRLLAERGHSCETILLDPEQHRAHDLARLLEQGTLPDAGTLLNLWDLLADGEFSGKPPAHIDPPLAPSPEAATIGTPDRGHRAAEARPRTADWSDEGALRLRTSFTAAGEILQRDHYRADGSLLVVDRRDTRHAGTVGGRRVTLHDRDGRPIRGWTSIWKLYELVLDAHLGTDRAVLFLDSKVSAPFGQGYRRPNVATVHIIHNGHLADGEPAPLGLLSESRAKMTSDLEAYDAVVCSTERQRNDLVRLLGPGSRIEIIPPAIAPVPASPDAARSPGHGVVLASLEPRKRLEDLIEAVAIARQAVADVELTLDKGVGRDVEITLDIYGSGSEEDTLAALIARLGLEGAVRLRGHDPVAKQRFAEASWTGLTSTREGFGMALAEAMSAGCVPFAYDVLYGPSDLLAALPQHLVADGDTASLGRRLADFVVLPEADREAQRRLVEHEAERFTPVAVGMRWAALVDSLAAALPRAGAPTKPPRMLALRVRRAGQGFGVEADFAGSRAKPLPAVWLGFAHAEPSFEWRREAQVRRLAGSRYRASATFPDAAFPAAAAIIEGGTLDVIAVILGRHGAQRIRLAEKLRPGGGRTIMIGVRGIRRWLDLAKRRLGIGDGRRGGGA